MSRAPSISSSGNVNYERAVRMLLALGKELAAPRQAHVQKFDLENIRVLSKHLGAPHRAVPSAHIAGTNGKGSTAAMLESILRAAGLSTGLFISPHLERINERIQFNGESISDEEFAGVFSTVQSAIETLLASGQLAAHPTFFECMTAMAFAAFARRPVDFAVYEVGMGGRLDSTNILEPQVAVITQVDMDHENFLGHSIAEIAAEKAGIIKPGGWVVSSAERPEARAVIARRAAELDARLVEIDSAWRIESANDLDGFYRVTATPANSNKQLSLKIPLRGKFQIRNALAAATAAQLLAARGFSISDEAITRGIENARWPGRLERLCEEPFIYFDGAHNPAAARELAAFWQEHLTGKRVWLVYGAMRDKAVDEIAGLLFPLAYEVIFTEPSQGRSISAPLLAEMTSHLARRCRIVPDPTEAFDEAISSAASDDAIFVTGSLYLVGALREHAKRRSKLNASTISTSLDLK
ncbi:MAG TPA: folylpolyglutamate synthase/dihydrofolate synthase family protein [Candidatus Acidoferrales bacterium]|nr:folylpolyglutamate synthase/dihydrofolate synthase family protein [Candidatus Acidoferrales bacterium]